MAFVPSDYLIPSPWDPNRVAVQGATVDSKGDQFDFDITKARYDVIYDTINLDDAALPAAGPTTNFLGNRTGKGLALTNRQDDTFLSKTQDMVILAVGFEIVQCRGAVATSDLDFKAIRDAGVLTIRYNQNTLWYEGLVGYLPSPYRPEGTSVETNVNNLTNSGGWQPMLVPKVFHGNCDTISVKLSFPQPTAGQAGVDPDSDWAARTLAADRWVRFLAIGFIIDN